MKTNQEIEEILKKAGIPVTVQRLALVGYILEADHPTADQVVCWAKQNQSKVNTATVYNTLKVLEEANIIKKVKFSHLPSFVYDNNVSDHFHFLDEDTGKITDLSKDSVKVSCGLNDIEISQVEVLIKGKMK